jgi:hypothetical protein
MKQDGGAILESLRTVDEHRARRLVDPGLARRVSAVKAYQHARFQATYADLLSHPRYRRAAQFFLEDLYGPKDFAQRDAQFARVVPALVRLFPADIVTTVRSLGQLHALSEDLDTAMACAPWSEPLDHMAYGQAWRQVGREDDRLRQINLMREVGGALDLYTRNPLLRSSLLFMRGPAKAAGLGALQTFLEQGFDTFREMRGAGVFLDTIVGRETALVTHLFQPGSTVASVTAG